MKQIHNLQELSWWLAENPQPAFVPTMGALHDGHLSLLKAAKKNLSSISPLSLSPPSPPYQGGGITNSAYQREEKSHPILVSIFVNPAQFGPHEDFAAYPRDFEGDLAKLAAAGADAVFLPEQQHIYPGARLHQIPELPKIFTELEGAIRPGHFEGVAQVLFRFFQLIRPQVTYFGQKDFQQTVLVKWLVRTCKFETEIVICPIVRETSGLAMSSRNAYLSDEQRQNAATLFAALQKGKRLYEVGERDSRNIIRGVEGILETAGVFASVDYVDIRGVDFFENVHWIAKPSALVAAVRMGKTRLLDNMIVG